MLFLLKNKASRVDHDSLFCLSTCFKTLFFCAFLSLFVHACDKQPNLNATPEMSISGETMGTYYHVKLLVPDAFPLNEAELKKHIDALLIEVNAHLSTYIPDSEISQLNQKPTGEVIEASPMLFYMLELSQQIFNQSGGAFDISIGPLVNLWGFGPQKPFGNVPTDEQITEAKKRIGSNKFVLDSEVRTLTKRADLYLDLSAIAKGYGADLVADELKKHGVRNFMVEIGGELHVAGVNNKGIGWVIGVENPSFLNTGASSAISLSNKGIATSGDYRNYYEQEGKRFSHTIDPQTGKPITHALASVTVIHKSAAEADAYATAINVLGPKAGYTLAETLNLAAYFIVRDGEGFTTKHTAAFTPYFFDLTQR